MLFLLLFCQYTLLVCFFICVPPNSYPHSSFHCHQTPSPTFWSIAPPPPPARQRDCCCLWRIGTCGRGSHSDSSLRRPSHGGFCRNPGAAGCFLSKYKSCPVDNILKILNATVCVGTDDRVRFPYSYLTTSSPQTREFLGKRWEQSRNDFSLQEPKFSSIPILERSLWSQTLILWSFSSYIVL